MLEVKIERTVDKWSDEFLGVKLPLGAYRPVRSLLELLCPTEYSHAVQQGGTNVFNFFDRLELPESSEYLWLIEGVFETAVICISTGYADDVISDQDVQCIAFYHLFTNSISSVDLESCVTVESLSLLIAHSGAFFVDNQIAFLYRILKNRRSNPKIEPNSMIAITAAALCGSQNTDHLLLALDLHAEEIRRWTVGPENPIIPIAEETSLWTGLKKIRNATEEALSGVNAKSLREQVLAIFRYYGTN
jgi:hypothetical protein